MSEQDGGPAFPQIEHGEVVRDGQYVEKWWPSGGMSLRDWFAGHALAGLMADRDNDSTVDECADTAYMLADEMIKSRERKL